VTPSSRPNAAQLSARIGELYRDAQACAAAAGLVYVTNESPGIRRQRSGRGFAYRDAKGRTITDESLKERIRQLAIPPAWREVWICPDDDGHIVAVGEDDRGRKQYLYHERWRTLRDLLNFYRLIGVGEHLTAVRAHVERQLRRRAFDRDRVLAAMVRIMDLSAVRVGNEVYAEENDSLGLTTLTPRTATVDGDQVRLRFSAKSGKRADLLVRDRAVARVVDRLKARRSRRLFTVDGRAIDSGEVNALLEVLSEGHITAKDFRTWQATHIVFVHLAEHLDVPTNEREQMVLAAIDTAAAALGNTRAVARSHYVHPALVTAYLDGALHDLLPDRTPRQGRLLAPSERRLLAVLANALEHEAGLASVPPGPAGRDAPVTAAPR